MPTDQMIQAAKSGLYFFIPVQAFESGAFNACPGIKKAA
jgi:hypothetical protein